MKTGEMYSKTPFFAYKSCEPDGITEEVCIPDAGLFRIAELIQPMNPTYLWLNVKSRLGCPEKLGHKPKGLCQS